jgi:hypothetical protein
MYFVNKQILQRKTVSLEIVGHLAFVKQEVQFRSVPPPPIQNFIVCLKFEIFVSCLLPILELHYLYSRTSILKNKQIHQKFIFLDIKIIAFM